MEQMLSGQLGGGVNVAFVEIGQFRGAYIIPSNPCQCRSLINKDDKGELVNAIIHGTIERFLEEHEGVDRVKVPIPVVAAVSIDNSIICLYPDCVCRSLREFVEHNPELSKKVLVEVTFVDNREYDINDEEDLARLRTLAAKYCVMGSEKVEALLGIIKDYIIMLIISREDIREEVSKWLTEPDKGLPTNTIKRLAGILDINIRKMYKLIKRVYVYYRDELLRALEEVTPEGKTQTITQPMQHKSSGCEPSICRDNNKFEMAFRIVSTLGLINNNEVDYCDMITQLCIAFDRGELAKIVNETKSISEERITETRKLIIDWALGRVSDNDLRVFFGLEARPVEPEPVNIKEARESLVRELEGLRDADRYAKAVRGARSELSRIIFEVLRANMQRKDPGMLQLIASTLADLILERPGVLMDIVHVETRCRDLGITCSGLWGAVKGAVDHVAEAVRHAKEFGNKKLRGNEAAEEVRAVTGEMVSETCLGIEEIRDAMLDIIYNAIPDKNLANTVRELLGKAVKINCNSQYSRG
jgi:hypothetical protein